MTSARLAFAGRAGSLLLLAALAACESFQPTTPPPGDAPDPGVRIGSAAAGDPLPGLSSSADPTQKRLFAMFGKGLAKFVQPDSVDKDGLGPTFNLDSCGGCHAYPAVGGSSPGPTASDPYAVNPQFAFWASHPQMQAGNQLPSFIVGNDPAHPGVTPVREARFVKDSQNPALVDGGVHDLFTIVGLTGTPASCTALLLRQPDFDTALATRNIIFRIPTPVFGTGLIEQIPDSAIESNRNSELGAKKDLGIRGRSNVTLAGRTVSGTGRRLAGAENRNGNDGTIARFGWKAQNKSLLVFAGEAYNVEMGVSNELFPTERNELPECQALAAPNDRTDPTQFDPTKPGSELDILSDIEKFAAFMRLLAPPRPSADTPGGAASIGRGRSLFNSVGCSYCHTPTLRTGRSDIPQFDRQDVALYSDLLLHKMGPGLADGISQGQAGPDEFRTAPLWGLGQRTYLLHDGRATDLVKAIYAHESGGWFDGSEANGVVQRYRFLSAADKRDLLNFLRSL
jgi:CxxC motif-containing protein (DUF1111 family)